MSHTDLTPDHFLLRALPPSLRPWGMLMRLDRPIGTWLLLLPAWWGILIGTKGLENFGLKGLYYLLLFAFGAIIMRAAGCIINDLWDRDLDAQTERTRDRPLASGAITFVQASVFLALLLWIGLIILVQLPFAAIVTGVVAVLLAGIYPVTKRITWYPQAVLGITFNLGVLMGCAASAGHISFTAWIVYVAGVFWTLAYDTIYAHQDMADDMVTGVKSTALKFGEHSPTYVAVFYALFFALLYAASMTIDSGDVFYILWGVAAFYTAIRWWLWKPDDASSSLNTFRAHRDCGLLIAFAFLLA